MFSPFACSRPRPVTPPSTVPADAPLPRRSRCRGNLPLPCLFLALLTLLACHSRARAQSLCTTDGKSYTGQTSLHANQIIVTKDGQSTTIDLANVAYASFNPPRPSTLAAGYLGPLSAHAIGTPAAADITFTRNLYAIHAAGTQIAGTADSFHFVSQGAFGDAEVSARLCSLSPAATAGVMFRGTSDPNAPHVSLLVTAAGQLCIRFRTQSGGNTSQIDLGRVTLPIHLSLARVDGQFVAATSPDGITWTRVAGPADGAAPPLHPIPVELPLGTLAGLAFAGGHDSLAGTACFDQFLLQEVAAPRPAPPAAKPQFRAWPHEAFFKGVLLRQGTFLAGATLSVDSATAAKITWQSRDYAIPLASLARVQKATISSATFARLPRAGPGVLLDSGDFLQGSITAFDNDRLEINNIVFGLSTVKSADAAAMVFGGLDVPPPGFRAQLLDGSILAATAVQPAPTGDNLIITEPSLGRLTIPATQLLSLQRTSGTVSLGDLPFTLSGSPATDAEALTCFGRASAFWLATDNTLLDRGILLPANASLTCHPPANCKQLQARIAVPQRLPDQAQLQFSIDADGKEVYRSPTLTSRDPSIPIVVPLDNPQQLSLRVTLINDTTVPAFGLWGNPLLRP